MSDKNIGVGIIGAGGWAKYGHIPVLKDLDGFEIVAISSRRKETADELAAKFGIPDAFGDERALIAHPGVDLVVILAPGPEHARLAKAAIAAGKDVYSEWPLSTTTAESEEVVALAQAKGVRHVVGLQRRFAPSARYTQALVKDGYVGSIRGVTMSVGVDAFGAKMPGAVRWVFDDANFTHVLSIYAAHFADMLFHSVGFPTKLTGIVENQIPSVEIIETGEKVPYTSPNEVMAIGTLEGGGLFSLQLEGGQERRTGLHIIITGSDGVLRITNARGFQNQHDNRIEGMKGDADTFAPLPVPAEYKTFEKPDLDQSVQDVAYLYGAYAQDRKNGTATASDFKDAVAMHRLIDAITSSSERFFQG